MVIGAGPTGLSAAYHLGEDSVLLEANDRVGGWCRSIVDNGFTFDFAGHIMFSNDPYVHEMYELLLGDNVHWQDREAWVYSKDVYTRYPFQGSLYGLPADVIKECIVGAIEARFGPLHSDKGGGAGPRRRQRREVVRRRPRQRGSRLIPNGKTHANGKEPAAGVQPARQHRPEGRRDRLLRRRRRRERPLPLAEKPGAAGPRAEDGKPRNFEEFIYKVWGAGIAKHFAVPYNRKIWAVPLDQMETSWLGGRVPLPDLGEMIEGALSPKPKPMGPNARFGYPLRGGFQALMDGFLPHLRGELRLEHAGKGRFPLPPGRDADRRNRLPYDQLVSTMPLPALIRAMGRRGAGRGAAGGGRPAAHVGAVREHRRRPRDADREALDLLPRGHGVPPHLRAGERQPALQPAGRVRADVRDHLRPAQAAAVRRRGPHPAVHRRLRQGRA